MNLYLIGYRGCGKSTVAPILAAMILWDVFDTDVQIETLTGNTIADIFATEGETGFRQWETTVIQAAACLSENVVPLGGGAVLSETNRETIRKSGRTVWLRAAPEVLWSRINADVKSDQTRPQLTDMVGLEEVQHVLKQRQSVYDACADYTVHTDQLNPDQIADLIANWWDPVDNT